MFNILNKNNSNNHKNPGDIEVCLDSKNTPVILPFKDRFLHMLVAGPVGSGKFSFTFLPMIYQDMQNPNCGITIIEPNDSMTHKAYAMARYFKRKVLYFNPALPTCPHFNPMRGEETEVALNIVQAFKEFNKDSDSYYLDLYKKLLTFGTAMLKRLFGDDISLNELSKLINDTDGYATEIIDLFSKINELSNKNFEENNEIISWFKDSYFSEGSKIYTDCMAIRSQLDRLSSHKLLKDILTTTEETTINFNEHLKNGEVVIINTCMGDLRDIGKLLGYMIMLEYQYSVFNRGNKYDNYDFKPNFLYVSEFQLFSNQGFVDVLTQGRSNMIGSHIGIQTINTIPKEIRELVLTNARNMIVYPGICKSDAEYYSKLFTDINKGAVFTHSDLTFRNFGEITHLLLNKNNFQAPSVGKTQPIPKDIDEVLNLIVEVISECIYNYKR